MIIILWVLGYVAIGLALATVCIKYKPLYRFFCLRGSEDDFLAAMMLGWLILVPLAGILLGVGFGMVALIRFSKWYVRKIK